MDGFIIAAIITSTGFACKVGHSFYEWVGVFCRCFGPILFLILIVDAFYKKFFK